MYFFLYEPKPRKEKSVGVVRIVKEIICWFGKFNNVIKYMIFLFETGIYQIEKIRFPGSHCQ